MFRHITLPLVWPFIMVAAVIRLIDALKAFDTIYVITLGGPGTSSETINILLYQTAFAYYDLGYGSAIVVVFFVLILLISLVLLRVAPAARHAGDEPRTALALRGSRAAGLYVSVLVLVSPALLFFLWMLSLSLKNEVDNTAYPPVFIPHPPTLANFVDVFAEERLPHLHDQFGDRVVLARPAWRCCSACRPATASPRRRPPRRRR